MEYKISDNFGRNDFACKCGVCQNEFKMSLTLIGILEHLKVKYNQKINIIRAYVCEEQSKVLFGNSNKDYHHLGKALDISIDNVSMKDLLTEVEAMPELTGIGVVPQENHIHIDIRDKEREVWIEERKEKFPLTTQKKQQYNLA
ncbi:MAG: DUF882 domain-containing protein [Candidatus Margulisbacteria bacterium]|nr:DUF882 domain-containing protein [Candidatus Margulisiibacteriota bacterium]